MVGRLLQVAERLQDTTSAISGRVSRTTPGATKIDALRAILRISRACLEVPELTGGQALRENYDGYAPAINRVLRLMNAKAKVQVFGEMALLADELRSGGIDGLWEVTCETKDALCTAGLGDVIRDIIEADSW